MNQLNVGEKVWYNSEDGEHVYRIIEIRGNVAKLRSDNNVELEAYLNELKPHMPCTMENAIGRPTCEYKRSVDSNINKI